jgi:hypothetical protein
MSGGIEKKKKRNGEPQSRYSVSVPRFEPGSSKYKAGELVVSFECLYTSTANAKPTIPIKWSFVFMFNLRSRGSRDSSVGIATGYGLDDRGVGVGVPVGSRIFSSPHRPDRLTGPPNLLSNRYRGLFPGDKAEWA